MFVDEMPDGPDKDACLREIEAEDARKKAADDNVKSAYGSYAVAPAASSARSGSPQHVSATKEQRREHERAEAQIAFRKKEQLLAAESIEALAAEAAAAEAPANEDPPPPPAESPAPAAEAAADADSPSVPFESCEVESDDDMAKASKEFIDAKEFMDSTSNTAHLADIDNAISVTHTRST